MHFLRLLALLLDCLTHRHLLYGIGFFRQHGIISHCTVHDDPFTQEVEILYMVNNDSNTQTNTTEHKAQGYGQESTVKRNA